MKLDTRNATLSAIKKITVMLAFLAATLLRISAPHAQACPQGNTFGTFAPNVDDPTVCDGRDPSPFGIFVKGFDANANTNWKNIVFFQPIIESNIFQESFNTNWHLTLNQQSNTDRNTFGAGSSAIGLENSSVTITGNLISDNGYSAGIGIRANPLHTAALSFSLICSNTISGMEDQGLEDLQNFDEVGIESNKSKAEISLNTISGNDQGIVLFSDDKPLLLGNSVTGNREVALDVNVGSIGMLQGLSSLNPPWNSGAYNTFSGNPFFVGEEEATPVISLEGNRLELDEGHNNIFISSLPPGVEKPLILGVSPGSAGILGNSTIDGNFWGNLNGFVDPNFPALPGNCSGCFCSACKWNTSGNGEIDAIGGSGTTFNYNSTSSSPGADQNPNDFPSTASCPTQIIGAGDVTSKKGPSKSSLYYDTVDCINLLEVIDNDAPFYPQIVYDSSIKFIEHCFNSPDAPDVFRTFSGALQQLAGGDTSYWQTGRQWLESVLYLNTTNPAYFCACVEAIAGTYHSPTDTSEELWWKDLNRNLAICQWLVDNTNCDTPTLAYSIKGARQSQYEDWLNDTTVPLDTTLPSMQELGLDTLLNKHFLYLTVNNPQALSILSGVSAYPNPANRGTVISFGIAKEAYVKIELYDLLGHPVSGEDAGHHAFESLFEPGNKAVPISLAGLQPGTYIARITTAYGEVQSVKIVKE